MGINGAANGGSISAFDNSSTIPLWLDGKQVTSDITFDIVSPVDHKTLYKCSAASEQDALKAIASAEKAFQSWSQTKPSVRRDIFLRAADIFAKRKPELGHYSHTETGAPESMFDFNWNLAYQSCKDVAGLIQAMHGDIIDTSDDNMNALLFKEPYGVVLGIGPWNAPYVLGLRACLQPLAM